MALEHYGVISYDIKKLLAICISTDCQKLSMLGQAEVSALMQYISSVMGQNPLFSQGANPTTSK